MEEKQFQFWWILRRKERELGEEGSETVEVGLRVTQECSGGGYKKVFPSSLKWERKEASTSNPANIWTGDVSVMITDDVTYNPQVGKFYIHFRLIFMDDFPCFLRLYPWPRLEGQYC